VRPDRAAERERRQRERHSGGDRYRQDHGPALAGAVHGRGVDGLLRDRTRPPGTAPVTDDRAAAIVAMTLRPPHHEATHWTLRAMARAAGLAPSTFQKIRKAHGLAPHRRRRFTRSNDPA
jgi:hypothetical protein